MEQREKRVCMIATGGTIASSESGEGLAPRLRPADILRRLHFPAGCAAWRRPRFAASTART